MEKGLYAAPMGLSDLAEQPDIEIELELEPLDEEATEDQSKEGTADDFDANLAEFMDDSVLQALGMDLVEDFDKDTGDRRD